MYQQPISGGQPLASYPFTPTSHVPMPLQQPYGPRQVINPYQNTPLTPGTPYDMRGMASSLPGMGRQREYATSPRPGMSGYERSAEAEEEEEEEEEDEEEDEEDPRRGRWRGRTGTRARIADDRRTGDEWRAPPDYIPASPDLRSRAGRSRARSSTPLGSARGFGRRIDDGAYGPHGGVNSFGGAGIGPGTGMGMGGGLDPYHERGYPGSAPYENTNRVGMNLGISPGFGPAGGFMSPTANSYGTRAGYGVPTQSSGYYTTAAGATPGPGYTVIHPPRKSRSHSRSRHHHRHHSRDREHSSPWLSSSSRPSYGRRRSRSVPTSAPAVYTIQLPSASVGRTPIQTPMYNQPMYSANAYQQTRRSRSKNQSRHRRSKSRPEYDNPNGTGFFSRLFGKANHTPEMGERESAALVNRHRHQQQIQTMGYGGYGSVYGSGGYGGTIPIYQPQIANAPRSRRHRRTGSY